jgi:hypothetical protein
MKSCFIWGEPFGHACPIPAMSDTVSAITAHWPQQNWIYQGQPAEELSKKFVANLYPPLQALLEAHQSWFEKLFVEPAREAGHNRWGLKEVRLTIDHARYLKWLFPQAKFLFLYRNPFDAWRSFAARKKQGWDWYYRWPDQPLTVHRFARHWNDLVQGFVEHHGDVDGMLVRYEDLKAQTNFGALDEYLGFEVDCEAAELRPKDGPPPVEKIEPGDLHVLHTELGQTAANLGYEYPFETPQGLSSTAKFRPNDRSRCVVLVPVGSSILPRCEQGLKELERRGYTVRRVYGFAAIDQGRNQMVTNALLDGFDETMWIDSDVAFNPDDVDRLRSHNLPISCGIYPQKGKRALACHVMPGTAKLSFGNEGGVQEILYAATGFLHVRREVYETIKNKLALPTCNQRFERTMEPFFQPMIRPDGEGNWYLAEDFAFCHRARDAGFSIFADTTIRLWHLGTYAYSWEDAGIEQKRFGTFHYNLTGAPANPQQVSGRPARETSVTSETFLQFREQYPWPEEMPDVPPEPELGQLSDGTRQILEQHVPRESKLIVELGSFLGLSSRFLLNHAPNAKFLAVDRWTPLERHYEIPQIHHVLDRLYETFLVNCWDYKDRLIPVRAETSEGLHQISQQGLTPDVFYVDSDHSYEAVSRELNLISQLFPSALIVGDDYDWEDVRRAIADHCRLNGRRVVENGVGWRLV